MNSPLLWLLFGLAAALVAGWRLVASRRRAAALKLRRDDAAEIALARARQAAQDADTEIPVITRTVAKPSTPAATAPGAPGGIERRSPARQQADLVIAAEAARRQAAIQKARNAARAEAPAARPTPATPAPVDVVTRVAAPRPAPTVVAFRAPAPTAAPADQGARPLAPVVPISRATAPVVEQPVAAKAPALAPRAETPVLAAPAPSPRAPAPKILKTPAQTLVMLADDSKMVRVKTSKLLAAHGFQIVTAIDGLDAIQQLESCLPDLVITDVDMPGMDGFGLTNHLRRTARTAHIPIVMITSAEDRHREEAMRIGVGLVMGKPYPEDELIAHIRSFAFEVSTAREPAPALA